MTDETGATTGTITIHWVFIATSEPSFDSRGWQQVAVAEQHAVWHGTMRLPPVEYSVKVGDHLALEFEADRGSVRARVLRVRINEQPYAIPYSFEGIDECVVLDLHHPFQWLSNTNRPPQWIPSTRP